MGFWDEETIKLFIDGDPSTGSSIIERFVNENAKTFEFPDLDKNTYRRDVWRVLFEYLTKCSDDLQVQCLSMIRILSRDKSDLETLITKEWVLLLVEKSFIYDESSSLLSKDVRSSDEVIIGSLMCLCNFTFNCNNVLQFFTDEVIFENYTKRVLPFTIENEVPPKDVNDDIKYYSMRLLFILTAKNENVRKMACERYGHKNLVEYLKNIIKYSVKTQEDQSNILDDTTVNILCEVLKTLFNFLMDLEMQSADDSKDESITDLVLACRLLLTCKACTDIRKYQLHNDIINILTCVNTSYYYNLSFPSVTDNISDPNYVSEEIDIKAVHYMVDFLKHQLDITQDIYNQNANLSPILSVMCKTASCYRIFRKYLRSVVLPPLKDVHTRPEVGDSIRNQLCRLLTTPVTQIRDLAAHFLFILCKENVSRMVKYTGYGNAAGLFATRGLLGQIRGNIGNTPYSSDSEDSDTEEYLAMKHTVNPVTGCYEPPRVDPMAGYTEEQKEYEAMKLVNLMDQLNRAGVVQPCRIGANGRPEPIEHVLQLQEDLPNQQVKKN